MNFQHYPVMNREVLEIFSGTRKKLFVDCTVGGGGHSHRILSAFPEARVIALDQDGESLALARENLRELRRARPLPPGHFPFALRGFRLPAPGRFRGPGRSGHLHRAAEGRPARFFPQPGRPAGHAQGPSAARPDRRRRAQHLFRGAAGRYLFGRFGEVPNARRLAKAIIEKRLFAPWSSTVAAAAPRGRSLTHWHPRPGLVHPAAKVFQALRIFVNRELEGLDAWLEKIPGQLPRAAAWSFSPTTRWRTAWSSTGSSSCSARKRSSCSAPFPPDARPRRGRGKPRFALGQAAGPGGRMNGKGRSRSAISAWPCSPSSSSSSCSSIPA